MLTAIREVAVRSIEESDSFLRPESDFFDCDIREAIGVNVGQQSDVHLGIRLERDDPT